MRRWKLVIGGAAVAAVLLVGGCSGGTDEKADAKDASKDPASTTLPTFPEGTPPSTKVPPPMERGRPLALRTWTMRVVSAVQEGDQVRVVVEMKNYQGDTTDLLAQPGVFTVRNGSLGSDVQAVSVEGVTEPLADQETRTVTLLFPMPGTAPSAVLYFNGELARGDSAIVPLFSDPPPTSN